VEGKSITQKYIFLEVTDNAITNNVGIRKKAWGVDMSIWQEMENLLIQSNFISKESDSLPYLIIIGAVENDVSKTKTKEWLGEKLKGREKDFNRMWGIARKQGIFIKKSNKYYIAVEDADAGLTDIEIALYGACLEGYITYSQSSVGC